MQDDVNEARYRKCALSLCPPFTELFGKTYGVCPLTKQCPDYACGYEAAARARAQAKDAT